MMSEISTTSFHHVVLTLLANQHQELNTNAISVHSNQGNGLLGLYVLTTYTAAVLISFNPPTNPGTASVMPLQATIAMITELNCQFLANQKLFTIYKSTIS
jgi:hypothetical protein